MSSELSQRVLAVLSAFPGPVTLRPSPIRQAMSKISTVLVFGLAIFAWVSLLAPSLLPAVGLAPMASTLLIALVLSAFAVLGYVMAFSESVVSLCLHQQGFDLNFPLNGRRASWNTAMDFQSPLLLGGYITYSDSAPPGNWLQVIGRWTMLGRERALNVTAFRTRELATLMNAWRERALSAYGSSSVSQ
jgi:hypothetical protein